MARRPNPRLLALEAPRAAREMGSYLLSRRVLGRAPRGDGHPVLVMPGFLGSDGSTRAARIFLRRLGYHVHSWKLGRNWGPTDRIIDGLGERFRTLLEQHDQRISLVGHSLGGIFARAIAERAPAAVRSVITLGSPVRLGEGSTNAEPVVRALSGLYSDRASERPTGDIAVNDLQVPLTAIISKRDGVVHWGMCTVDTAEHRECIVVRGSHSGLIHNPAALLVVADRLAQPPGEWRPYAERDDIGARIWTPTGPGPTTDA